MALTPDGRAHPVTPVAVNKRLEMIADGRVQVFHKPTHAHPYKECFGFTTGKHAHHLPDGDWKVKVVSCEEWISHCEQTKHKHTPSTQASA